MLTFLGVVRAVEKEAAVLCKGLPTIFKAGLPAKKIGWYQQIFLSGYQPFLKLVV